MAKLVGTTLKAVNIFVVVVYLLACLIPWLAAGKFWITALTGLIFPFLALVVIIFLIDWLIARSRWCILPLLALVLSYRQLSVIAGLNREKAFSLKKENGALRILTWNVSSWGETNKDQSHRDEWLPLMIKLVKEQEADVLCFQEFWDKRAPYEEYSTLRDFKAMGYQYYYHVKTTFEGISFGTGVAILSKYPITDSAAFEYGKHDFAEHLIYADIQFNRQKIRIFTTHLQSVQLEEDPYAAIRKIKHRDESGVRESKTIIRKLKNAYELRSAEAILVKQKIKESPYPVIICGDFNDVPNSYTYFTIRGDLQDAFLKKGAGLGRTYQYLSPTLRIDYILAAKSFSVNQFKVINVPYSDHYPLVTDLRPPAPKGRSGDTLLKK